MSGLFDLIGDPRDRHAEASEHRERLAGVIQRLNQHHHEMAVRRVAAVGPYRAMREPDGASVDRIRDVLQAVASGPRGHAPVRSARWHAVIIATDIWTATDDDIRRLAEGRKRVMQMHEQHREPIARELVQVFGRLAACEALR